MTDTGNTSDESRLEAYLDGLLPESERPAFEVELRAHPQLHRQIELQRALDQSMGRLFPVRNLSASRLTLLQEQLRTSLPDADAKSRTVRFPWGWLMGAATAAAVALIAWNLWSAANKPRLPYFEPRPVAELYAETVSEGFEPYYECRDEDRFVDTFASRQGVPLTLAQMPSDRRMLGLSYPGGLSRETTAMLGQVRNQPVMVFVDSIDKDNPKAGHTTDPDLNVFREARDELVFYEVTPLDRPSLIQYLVPIDSQATRYFSDVD